MGLAFSYCHPGYGFAVSGCLLPEKPTTTADNWARTITAYYNDNKKPRPWSVAILTEDTPAGKTAAAINLAQFQANKFNVTYAKPSMPGPPAVVGDFSPYVEAVLTSNKGKAPDLVVLSIGSTSAFGFVKALGAAGYTGDTSLVVLRPPGRRPPEGHARHHAVRTVRERGTGDEATRRRREGVQARRDPGPRVEAGYLAADMFIKAMQKVGKNPTPEKLQKVASTMTYKLQGVQCPTTYPKAWKQQTGGTGLVKSNGTSWEIVVPYTPVDTCARILSLKGHPKSI